MSEKETWDLMVRNLAGEATTAEEEILAGWLATSQSHRELYTELRSIWQDSAPVVASDVPRRDALEAYEVLSARIRRATPVVEPQDVMMTTEQRPDRVTRKLFTPWQIAASLLLLAACGALGYYFFHDAWNIAGSNWVTASNAADKPKRITLPDSSHVWLHGQSALSYPGTFAADSREVKLTGEAFFEVTENKNAPFSVTAGTLRTTVLGTSFDINAFDHEQQISVTVVTGRVQVARATAAQRYEVLGVLRPNEKITYHHQGNNYTLTQLANAYAEASWKDGTLRFRDMNFGQIARRLEQWYGVTIQFENRAIMQCELEGSFNNVPLEKVLKMLSMTANFTYRVEGQTVTITGDSCLE